MHVVRAATILSVSVLMLMAAACSQTSSNANAINTTVVNANASTSEPAQNINIPVTQIGPAVTVSITSDGFSPDTVTVKVGETVTWKNDDSTTRWPAADPHPLHNSLPGGFDSSGIPSGATYSFTFLQAGRWMYHDDLLTEHTGSVIVE